MKWQGHVLRYRFKIKKLNRCESFLETRSAVKKYSLELVLCIVSFFAKGIGWCYDPTPPNRNRKKWKGRAQTIESKQHPLEIYTEKKAAS